MWVATKAITDNAGTEGDGPEAPEIRKFKDDENANVDVTHFGGRTIAFFFANSQQAFNDVKDDITDDIKELGPLKDFTDTLTIDMTLAQVGIHILLAGGGL
jgi:hypothetical protein